MKVILFGATGMIGRGVLRECLADERVAAVLAVGRAPHRGHAPEAARGEACRARRPEPG
ncbi:hypothetical protein [Nonomuraea salmonea]|uniref:hypothetical protein n=1 Tax=Nonomuraea salmonea TaxID=46181 RepID=UPI0031F05AA6